MAVECEVLENDVYYSASWNVGVLITVLVTADRHWSASFSLLVVCLVLSLRDKKVSSDSTWMQHGPIPSAQHPCTGHFVNRMHACEIHVE